MPSEETKVIHSHSLIFQKDPSNLEPSQERVVRAIDFGRVCSIAPQLVPRHSAELAFADRAPLWLDSFHHLCGLHAEQPSAVFNQVRLLDAFFPFSCLTRTGAG